jgi:hypothetical protein
MTTRLQTPSSLFFFWRKNRIPAQMTARPHEGFTFAFRRLENSAVMYQFTLADKIAGALEGLRIRFFPRRILVAGPYMGEFGHELMEWQAWVRAQVPRYWEVHVITFPGREALYPGCIVHTHDVPLEKAGYRHGRCTPLELKTMARAKADELGLKNYDILTAQHLCTRYHQKYILPARYELLRTDPLEGRYRDIAFHFRWVKKEGPDQTRNYPTDLCDQVAALCVKQGHSICCIGHPRYSYCPPGVEDLRSEDLQASLRAISSARLVAGELSGPMHLAQLCGIPILIWADGQWRLDNSESWNVFRVPTYIVANDTHRPDTTRVAEVIDRALLDLRQRTANFSKPSYTLPP